MAINTTFIDFQTPINSDWLNNVNTVVNNFYFNVKQFGAKGDGVTNDTAAIQSADAAARAVGGIVYIPFGTYMVSQLVIYTQSHWLGDGRQQTILKQIIGTNLPLIYGANSNANWGNPTPSNIVNGYWIEGLTINGNWNNGTGNTSGDGIAVYGSRPIMRDLFITNCAGNGLRTEYTDSGAGGIDTFTMEGHYENIHVDTVGQNGWWNRGPHDSSVFNMIVVDASQAAANTYDAFLMDTGSTGGYTRLHGWTRSTSVRMQSALHMLAGSQGDFVACHFEGAYTANVLLLTSGCTFDDTCHYYSAWNGVTFYMGGSCALNTIRGFFDAPAAGRPATAGISMGSLVSDFISDNDINVHMASQEVGNFLFNATATRGSNRIRATCYNNTTATYIGTPATNDDVDIMIHNTSGLQHLINTRQVNVITIGPNTTATWTYLFPFAANPVVTFSPVSPSGAITSGIWINSDLTTSVTFYNNNSVTVNLNCVAIATT